jgi:hypothetical protein
MHPTPADWAANRDLITDLYEKQNLKLADVMQIMHEKHKFYAT